MKKNTIVAAVGNGFMCFGIFKILEGAVRITPKVVDRGRSIYNKLIMREYVRLTREACDAFTEEKEDSEFVAEMHRRKSFLESMDAISTALEGVIANCENQVSIEDVPEPSKEQKPKTGRKRGPRKKVKEEDTVSSFEDITALQELEASMTTEKE